MSKAKQINKSGFTTIQLVIAMTVLVVLISGVFVWVQDNTRKKQEKMRNQVEKMMEKPSKKKVKPVQ